MKELFNEQRRRNLEAMRLALTYPSLNPGVAEVAQVPILKNLADFIGMSYVFGSNPLSVLRQVFDKFSWETVPVDLSPGNETMIVDEVKDASFLFFDCGDSDGFTLEGVFLIKVTPTFDYKGQKFVVTEELEDHKLAVFLRSAGFVFK